MSAIRVGVDVGGTFTKAVALTARPLALRAHAVVPTATPRRGRCRRGRRRGARATLLDELGADRDGVELVAFSTTQAMNALLEGDVAQGRRRRHRRRARPAAGAQAHRASGEHQARPGRVLHTEHAFLDATGGLSTRGRGRRGARRAAGCRLHRRSRSAARSPSTRPSTSALVSERARERGLPVCAGHELTGAYGLETRTVSAAINASILPDRRAHRRRRRGGPARGRHRRAAARPARRRRRDEPRGVPRARRRSRSARARPPASAAALHELALPDGIVLECGGTSSNVSVVKGGRTALRTLRVMGRPTAIRSVDSWVVGAAGGSMARLGRRRIEETGPAQRARRRAPVRLLSRTPTALADGRDRARRPARGRPRALRRAASSPTAAAARSRRPAPPTRSGLARGVRTTRAARRRPALACRRALGAPAALLAPSEAATRALDGAVDKIAQAVAEAARAHDLGPDVPIVALGGAGRGARARGRRAPRPPVHDARAPRDPQLDRRGAVARARRGRAPRRRRRRRRRLSAARPSRRASTPARRRRPFASRPRSSRAAACCGASRPAPSRSSRARPTASRSTSRRSCAARRDALGLSRASLELVARNDFYRVFCENGSGRVAVVDGLGSVAFAENAKSRHRRRFRACSPSSGRRSTPAR